MIRILVKFGIDLMYRQKISENRPKLKIFRLNYTLSNFMEITNIWFNLTTSQWIRRFRLLPAYFRKIFRQTIVSLFSIPFSKFQFRFKKNKSVLFKFFLVFKGLISVICTNA